MYFPKFEYLFLISHSNSTIHTVYIIFSLPLTSFPMMNLDSELILESLSDAAGAAQSFSDAAQNFSDTAQNFSDTAQNFQETETKCQHSSSLMSSIKKRNLLILKEIH